MAAVALTRFLFRSHDLYDLDSVDFALGIRHFDPAVYQPHPPGYFLYVYLGRLINLIFQDANTALVAISIGASCGAAAMIYVLANEWFGVVAARFAGLIFLCSPLAWFHGTVALTYIVEAFFSALIGYICWLSYQGSKQWIPLGALLLGLAAGVRPSTLLFLGPLLLFSARRAPPGKVLAAIGVLILALLAWFVPMVYASGGPGAYFGSLALLWRMAAGRQNTLFSFPLLSIARFFTTAGIVGLCFGSAGLLFVRTSWTKPISQAPVRRFTWVWIAPALLFFTFVFLRFVNSGYLLVVFPPLCAWVAGWAAEWYGRLRFPALKVVFVMAAVAVNIGIFIRAPLYCSYREVRSFEAELARVKETLPQVAKPGQTLIVAFDSHFLGFRHAGYYFPEYRVVEYPEVQVASGKLVFTMSGRETRLVRQVPSSGLANFVLFPMPIAGDEYRQYLNQIRAKFPVGHLRTTMAGGHAYVSGPAQDLPALFPNTATGFLYTGHHVTDPPVYKR